MVVDVCAGVVIVDVVALRRGGGGVVVELELELGWMTVVAAAPPAEGR